MKKIIAVLMALAMVLAVVACAKPAATETAAAPATQAASEPAAQTASEPAAQAEGGMKVALVTDVGNIDDKSFNQGAWEGVVAFCEGKGLKPSIRLFRMAQMSLSAPDICLKMRSSRYRAPTRTFSSCSWMANPIPRTMRHMKPLQTATTSFTRKSRPDSLRAMPL